MERDRLLLFLEKLILNKENVKAVLDAKGVSILVNLLTLAHLHTARYVYILNVKVETTCCFLPLK